MSTTPRMQRRRAITSALGLLVLSTATRALAESIDAPNFTLLSPTLATSGQPTAEALATLGAHGFQAVVYLAPSTVANAVKEEPELLAPQGIEFVHVPVPFGAPDESHLDALSAALSRLRERKVLVHCEINMRASTLVFLYRVIHLKESPSLAYEAVARVWSPRGPWRRLVEDQLAKNRITFEPY